MSVQRIPVVRPALIAIALATLVAACGIGPSITPTASPVPSAPAESPTPVPSDEPTPGQPTPGQPTPGQPTASPTTPPIGQPIKHIKVPSFARATADRVNVRTLPGLAHPLVEGKDTINRTVVKNIQLSVGQQVTVGLGPVVVDGYSWYQVIDTDEDTIIWGSGWVAGEFLRFDREVSSNHGTILAFHAIGVSSRYRAQVAANSNLFYSVMAVPVDGAQDCEATVAFMTNGTSHPGVSVVVTKPTMLWQSRVENYALHQASAGEVTFSVISDCSYAAIVTAVPAG